MVVRAVSMVRAVSSVRCVWSVCLEQDGDGATRSVFTLLPLIAKLLTRADRGHDNWSRDTKLNKTVHYGHTDYNLQCLLRRIVLMGSMNLSCNQIITPISNCGLTKINSF